VNGSGHVSGFSGQATEQPELNQFEDEPHDRNDEHQDQHYALSWFQRLRQTNDSESGKSEGHQNEQHARSIAVTHAAFLIAASSSPTISAIDQSCSA
jgi:hypothetical protein